MEGEEGCSPPKDIRCVVKIIKRIVQTNEWGAFPKCSSPRVRRGRKEMVYLTTHLHILFTVINGL